MGSQGGTGKGGLHEPDEFVGMGISLCTEQPSDEIGWSICTIQESWHILIS